MHPSNWLAVAASTIVTAQRVYPDMAAVSWEDNRIDVLGTTDFSDGSSTVWHKYYTQAGGWEPSQKFENLSSLRSSVPAGSTAISWGPNRLDYFTVDAESQPWHKYWDGSNWQPQDFEKLRGETSAMLHGDIAAASWGPDRIDVVGWNEDNTYSHLYWNGKQWNGWEDIWGPPNEDYNFGGPPALVSWGKNRFDVFGIGEDGFVYHKFWDGQQYQPSKGWEQLSWKAPENGFLTGALTATSWGEQRMDVWAVGVNGQLYHTLWDHDYYGPWESLGGENFIESPAVAHWAPNRIDVVVQDGSTDVYQYKFWDGSSWNPDATGWYSKAEFGSNPKLTSWGPGNLNILGVDYDGNLKWQAWNQTEWIPAHDAYFDLGNIFSLGDDKETADSDVAFESDPQQIVMDRMKVDV